MMKDEFDTLSTLPLTRLARLLEAQDAKLALIAATGDDPDARAEVETKRARIVDQISRRTTHPRLPYPDPE